MIKAKLTRMETTIIIAAQVDHSSVNPDSSACSVSNTTREEDTCDDEMH
jgi:hypothetical protein